MSPLFGAAPITFLGLLRYGSRCRAEIRTDPDSGGLQVDRSRLAAATVVLDVEGHLLSLDEAAQTRLLDGGDVDEHVLSAGIGLDEPVALDFIEPFDGTSIHPG